MSSDAYADGVDPMTAHLHLHRGPGVGYGLLAAGVLIIAVMAARGLLVRGSFGFGILTLVAGVGVAGFLGLLSAAVLLPELHVNRAGVRGRMARGRAVDVPWTDVTIDGDEETPGQLQVIIGEESLTILRRSWFGYRNFVVVVASTAAATAALTPAARTEVIRLLHLGEPPDEPESGAPA